MIPIKVCISDTLIRRSRMLATTILNRTLNNPMSQIVQPSRGKKDDSNPVTPLTSLFRPVPVKPTPDDINVGMELTAALKKDDLLRVLHTFILKKEIKSMALEYGLDDCLQKQAFKEFQKYCLEAPCLPVDLHVVLSDILQGAGNAVDIFPYFIRHAKQMFPHLDCLEDLRKISDLRSPANWYPSARAIERKIIFHVGPTNSGKTYHALKKFLQAKTGIYCGPLKLLATEVFTTANKQGTCCDLVTGEERKFGSEAKEPANHTSCTVEMANINNSYEVAVIDEIQMVKDQTRGWAWTRALLGIPADEVHLCGEFAAIDLVKSICSTVGEQVEIHEYKRLTKLEVEKKALVSFNNIQPGDCVVCFSKNDIFTATQKIESLRKEVAVIYGSLPPGTKLAQAEKFNNPDHPCKVMVATDAIGLGLNLHIRRIIFYSLVKPTINEKGEKEIDTISISSALQIAGRAGRYGTQWENGYVTTFKAQDLPTLVSLLEQKPEVLTQAGIHPTADQIELYGYHLPNAPLSNLMDIFVSLCKVDNSHYFMCNITEFKFLADMIQHVPLPLRARYVFCCAPINKKVPFVCTMFLKFARQYSKNDAVTYNWLCENIGWPVAAPKKLLDLVHLESVFDVLDLYLWLSYRFMDLFPHADLVRKMQAELDIVILNGIIQLTTLLKNDTSIEHLHGPAIDENDSEVSEQFEQSREIVTSIFQKKGKLTERLIAQGLLTPSMLRELQREWTEKVNHERRSKKSRK